MPCGLLCPQRHEAKDPARYRPRRTAWTELGDAAAPRSPDCRDIVIAVHPGFTDLERKLKERTVGPRGPDPFIDAHGCQRYAEDATQRLNARLAEERAAP